MTWVPKSFALGPAPWPAQCLPRGLKGLSRCCLVGLPWGLQEGYPRRVRAGAARRGPTAPPRKQLEWPPVGLRGCVPHFPLHGCPCQAQGHLVPVQAPPPIPHAMTERVGRPWGVGDPACRQIQPTSGAPSEQGGSRNCPPWPQPFLPPRSTPAEHRARSPVAACPQAVALPCVLVGPK